MDPLEARIATLEAEVQRCVRQNRRMRAMALPLLVVAALPFLSAWNRGREATFDSVTAETFYVKRGDKVLASLAGGTLRLFSAEAGLLAELGRLDHTQAGVLKLIGPKRPQHRANIEMGIDTFGNSRLAFYGEPQSTTASLSLQVAGRGNGSIHLSNPPGTTVFSLGSDGKGDSTLRLADSTGRTTVLLDALPRGIGLTGASRRSLPGRNLTSTGGGGQITLTNPSGATTFKAPAESGVATIKKP